MSKKSRVWLLVLAAAVVCGLSLWGIARYRSARVSPASLLLRMPASDAVVIYVDFAALRAGGVLELLRGANVPEEPEYRDFVRATRFDYRQDLDSAMVAFSPSGKYLFLKGRFDWNSLSGYVRNAGGRCDNPLCRMEGSTPERRISFFPVRQDLMALAVSQDDSAALRLNAALPGPAPEVPSAPVWISIPASVLKTGESLPSGTRMFARGLERADSVTLAFAPEGAGVAARLDVRCRNEQEAADLVSQMQRTTSLLGQLIAREKQAPNAADLSGVLTTGTFRSEGRKMLGSWQLGRAFLSNLLSGGAN